MVPDLPTRVAGCGRGVVSRCLTFAVPPSTETQPCAQTYTIPFPLPLPHRPFRYRGCSSCVPLIYSCFVVFCVGPHVRLLVLFGGAAVGGYCTGVPLQGIGWGAKWGTGNGPAHWP